jgi:CRP-like cAMP-binding protein
MPFEWLQTPLDAPVSELFARGRRSRAIDQIRKQLQGQIAPSVELRIELVDLLVEAGRVKEAVPVLLGLADESARDGFVAKAVAALKRVEKIEPGRSDVESRLARLVHQQHQAAPLAQPEPARTEAASAADAPTPGPEIDLSALAVETATPSRDEPEDSALKGAFRRFLEDVGGPVPEAALEGDGSEIETVDADALAGEPATAAATPAADEPVVEAETLDEDAVSADESMSEADFDEELITLAADVVQRAPEPPADPERVQSVAVAERLLACDLFASVAEEELLGAVRALKLRVVEPGAIIVAEGEPGEGLYIVTAGSVKVFIRNPSGRNVPVARLGEGQYFGEIASLSGRPRTATVTAAGRTELLELDAPTLRELATRHPALRRRLEDVYVQRVSSPEAIAVRSVPLADAEARLRAAAALRSHFGEGRWEPRVRLKLAEVLLRTGKEEEALALLAALADDLLREGFPEKAVAVLKKIERLRQRHVEVVSLAPLPVIDPDAEAAPAAVSGARRRNDAMFQSWLLDVLRDRVRKTATRAPAASAEAPPAAAAPVPAGAIRAYEPGLRASPLLEGLAEDEQLALLHGLDLVSAQPGDILVSQGERGDSLYILASGAVRVYVREEGGDRPEFVCALGEGSFFGEMSALTDEPRSASVVAAASSELLKLDREGLAAIAERHPRVRSVLEEHCRQRKAGPQ